MYLTSVFIERFYRSGFYLVILLVLVDLLVFWYYPDHAVGEIFLATREQTPLTWVSAVSFFMIGLGCVSMYFVSRRVLWYILGWTFFFFSMDDATYFHERISGFLAHNTDFFGGLPIYVWVVLYTPLIFFALGSLIVLLWRDSSQSTKKRLIAAFILLGCAVGLDVIDGVVEKNDQIVFCLDVLCDRGITHMMRLTEEVLEVLALGVLGYTLLRERCCG